MDPNKIIFATFLLLILCIGAVSATNKTDTLNIDDESNVDENKVITGVSDDDILRETTDFNNTSFEELQDAVNTYDVINLKQDVKQKGSTVIDIKKSITINGNGHTIDADGKSGIFNITADNVVLNNITFINANRKNNDSRAIFWSGDNGTITDCTFKNNTAYHTGGAIYWQGDNGKITNTHFTNNNAESGGAIEWRGVNGKIINTRLTNNTATLDGGAIEWRGVNGTITNTNLINNTADYGGAIYWIGTNGTINNTNLINNTSNNDGGAIHWDGDNGTITNINLINNTSNHDGGAIHWDGDNGTITNTRLTNNTADIGGAILWWGVNGTITNTNLTNNLVTYGGAIYWIGYNGQINNTQLTNNKAINNRRETYGGAIYWIGDNGTITNTHFTNNTADIGGAIHWWGINGTITNTHFTNNTSKQNGGAILWWGVNGTITNTNLTNNKARDDGGAIHWIGGYGIITNTRLTNNKATNGGAIYWFGDNGIITNTRLTNNKATNGGAIYWFGDNGIITNTRLTNNKATDGGAIRLAGSGSYIIDASTFTDNGDNTLNSVIYIWSYFANCTVKNSIFNNNCTYEIYNNNQLSLENNTLSKFIYNNGTILSKTNITVLDNSTAIAPLNESFNITAIIKDDNNNIIITAKPVTLLINETSIGNAALDKGTYYQNKTFDTLGKYIASVSAVKGFDKLIYSATIIVKEAPKMNVTLPSTATYGRNITVTVKLPIDARGNITVNGHTIAINDTFAGTLTYNITDLPGGENNVTISYSGDDKYANDTKTKSITVTPSNITINDDLKVDSAIYGNTKEIKITGTITSNIEVGLNYTGDLLIYISGQPDINQTVKVNPNATFETTLNLNKALKAGKYDLCINVTGNENYTANNKTFSQYLSVEKANVTIDDLTVGKFTYGENNTAIISGKVKSNIQFGENYNGTVTVTIMASSSYPVVDISDDLHVIVLSNTNTTIVNDDGTFEMTIVLDKDYISAGKYNITVETEEKENYNASRTMFADAFNVERATVQIESVDDITVVYGVNNTVNVTGKIETVKYGVNYTGPIMVKIAEITAQGNAVNGTFNVEITGVQFFEGGEYKIKVNGSENTNYTALSEKTAVFNVTKAQFEIDATVTGVSEGSVKVDQNATVTIDISNIPASPSNTTGEIIINVTEIDKNYIIKVPVENNTIQLDIIANPGTYTLNTQYTGNKNYKATEIVTKTFTVTKWNETNLQSLINNSTGNVTLEHDYEFTNENATVNVTNATVINGNGHTIDANGSSTALNITADNVTISNVNGTGIATSGANTSINNTEMNNITGTGIVSAGENTTISNTSLSNVNGTGIDSDSPNTTINNTSLENVNGTAIQIDADNATVNNVTATNTTGFLMNITGDNIAITNVNSTNNSTIILDGKVTKTENITGATIIPSIKATSSVVKNNVIITTTVSATESNVTVLFEGLRYTVPLNEGKVIITIPNVGPGTYKNVPVRYDGTSLYQNVSTNTSFTSKAAITGNKDVTINYLIGYKYTVRVMNADGTYSVDTAVIFTVNGVTYTKKTDSNGYAKLLIELKPKTYKITTKFLNIKKTNKITVKYTLKLVKKRIKVKKTAKKLVLKATLNWSNGKAIKGKIVKFKFQGKTYKAKTNKKGIAKATIKNKNIKKLKTGKKYDFTAQYVNEYVKGKVKVKK